MEREKNNNPGLGFHADFCGGGVGSLSCNMQKQWPLKLYGLMMSLFKTSALGLVFCITL